MLSNSYEKHNNFNRMHDQSWGFIISHSRTYVLEIIQLKSQMLLTNPLTHGTILLQIKFPVKASMSCSIMTTRRNEVKKDKEKRKTKHLRSCSQVRYPLTLAFATKGYADSRSELLSYSFFSFCSTYVYCCALPKNPPR